MKRITAFLLVAVLLCGLLAGSTLAANKAQKTRTIAIVFDNSGSMYGSYNTSWCCATYALEVFASMLNEGDKLLVYPMNDISIGSDIYNFYQTPLIITSPDQAKQIESIYTIDEDGGTPIESVTAAYNGLKNESGEKWLLVLTDGQEFFEDGLHLGNATKKRVSETLTAAASDVNVMYLGIGSVAVHPDVSSANYHESFAQSGAEIPDKLTEMCNIIFGRNTLPANHISGDTVDFDVSISKMIVFIQGTDIANVKVSGPGGTQGGGQDVHYPKLENAYPGNAAEDKSLQGMIVTYTDCPSGTYNITYSGTKNTVEVYYEPDVDIMAKILDKDGNEVDPNAGLPVGDYTIVFTMIDRQTGEETTSDLLGKQVFSATRIINSQPTTLDDQTGSSCSIPISVKKDDKLEITVTAHYLTDYSITRSNENFGWPAVIPVVLEQPKKLGLKLSGYEKEYMLTTLENNEPIRADITYDGQPLTGKELESVTLDCLTDAGDVKIVPELKDDHFDLWLKYPDGINPMDTRCGDYSISVTAEYTPPNCYAAKAEDTLAFTLTDNNLDLAIEMDVPTDYYIASKLAEYDPIKVRVSLKGAPVSDEELERMGKSIIIDTDGIDHTDYEIIPGASAFRFSLQPSDDLKMGKHTIRVSITAEDELGRQDTRTAEKTVGVHRTSRLVIFLIIFGILLALAVIAHFWFSAKVLPNTIRIDELKSSFKASTSTIRPKETSVTYDRKAGTLDIMAPHLHGYRIACGATLHLKPLSPRMTRSANRRVLVESFEERRGVKEMKVASAKYEVDPKSKALQLKRGTPELDPAGILMVRLKGTATKTDSTSTNTTPAELAVKLIFE